MRTIILIVAICLSLAACGVKGDPEAPPEFHPGAVGHAPFRLP